MTNEDNIGKLDNVTTIDPTKFDVTVSALLLGTGAQKYEDIFRKNNIGQCTLAELSDEDLEKLGVDDAAIRKRLIEEVKNLPLYANISVLNKVDNTLGLMEIVEILEDSSQHLYRLYLSILANTLAVKKTKNITDCLVYQDKYASEIAIATVSEITSLVNNMDIALHTQLKNLTKDHSNNRNKKIIVGTVGSMAIVGLAIFFAKSLMDLK